MQQVSGAGLVEHALLACSTSGASSSSLVEQAPWSMLTAHAHVVELASGAG